MVQSKVAIIGQIERWIRRFKSETHERRLTLTVHPSIAAELSQGTFNRLRKLMLKFFIVITLIEDKSLAVDEFHFISKKQNKDVTGLYMNA